MPDAIKQIPARTFALCVLWAFVATAAPAGATVGLWLVGMAARPDWPTLIHQAAFHGALGVAAFWRKNKALLQLPPMLEEVKTLVAGVKVTEKTSADGATTKTVETTVSESHTEQT